MWIAFLTLHKNREDHDQLGLIFFTPKIVVSFPVGAL